ncbi:hypothetical protein ColLi_10930 [Colletotrichum liriopes]|uniref:Uncharacterized protein n=1 Tax=Colletotrichum liriopes TaxID=708192 RepID=A0AA37LXC1_9PEZI|nr:hypothetical protein ColLi_10930 [Colletotrichum liriopes]
MALLPHRQLRYYNALPPQNYDDLCEAEFDAAYLSRSSDPCSPDRAHAGRATTQRVRVRARMARRAPGLCGAPRKYDFRDAG